ncbi:Hypothetical_protein [Hexamita inflata]|uniref:Hypothetical_protein n=1 Tax=Hexamita inflata TaxID=28002 RepID=A0AA86NQ88_9EUKA|nr:Hypothetical protein HINF_LOCUS10943 [Hexamita inflata]
MKHETQNTLQYIKIYLIISKLFKSNHRFEIELLIVIDNIRMISNLQGRQVIQLNIFIVSDFLRSSICVQFSLKYLFKPGSIKAKENIIIFKTLCLSLYTWKSQKMRYDIEISLRLRYYVTRLDLWIATIYEMKME